MHNYYIIELLRTGTQPATFGFNTIPRNGALELGWIVFLTSNNVTLGPWFGFQAIHCTNGT